jgi:DNA invertase Pin-like site-specific DNA recombinase
MAPQAAKTRSNGVCAYLRVSSASQSVELQKKSILDASQAAGDVVGSWFQESASGGGRRPPVLLKLLDWARLGKCQRLYVYRLDRLSRRGIRDLLSLVHELESLNVELVTLADGFTLAGPARDVILAVLAWAAQMERLALGERIRAARTRIEAKGGTWGRPKRMLQKEATQARALRAQGKTFREIAVALKVPRATVWRYVSQKGGPKKRPPPLRKRPA